MDLHDFRTNYSLRKLSKSDLNANPIAQFELWLQQTIETGVKDPTAMIVATVDADGQPSQRYVLLKKFDEHGFVFFTDTTSAKGLQLIQNPHTSLLFPWHHYERQIRVQGASEQLSVDEAKDYFYSRPLGSQLAAAVSNQSQPIGSRKELLKRYLELEKSTSKQVDFPERWGGYCVTPTQIEFWQGGEHRLHDRFVYSLINEEWQIQRLQP